MCYTRQTPKQTKLQLWRGEKKTEKKRHPSFLLHNELTEWFSLRRKRFLKMQKKGLKLSPKEVEGVISCNEDCLIPLLESVYKKVTSYSNSPGGEKKDSPKARKPKREVKTMKEVGGPVESYANQLEMEMRQKPRVVASTVQQQIDHSWPAQAQTSSHFDDDYNHGGSYSPFKIEPMHAYSPISGQGRSRGAEHLHFHPQERATNPPSAGSYHHHHHQQQQQQHWDPFEFGKYSYERQVPIVASVSNEPPSPSYYRDFHQVNEPCSYPQSSGKQTEEAAS